MLNFEIAQSELGFTIKRSELLFNLNQIPIVFEQPSETLVFNISTQPIRFDITGGVVSYVTETIVQEDEVAYSKLVDWIDDSTVYIGQADPGTATSAPAWRIKKIEFVTDVDGNEDSTETWADGVGTFIKIWDNRASYTYS